MGKENRPSVSIKGEIADIFPGHGFLERNTERGENQIGRDRDRRERTGRIWFRQPASEQWYVLGLLVHTAVRSKPRTEKRISRRFVMYTRVCTVVTISESVHKPREWDDRLGLYDGSRVPGARMVLTGLMDRQGAGGYDRYI